MATDPVLQRLVDAIVAGTQPRRVILFGSRARGDAKDDSDYDFVVELDTPLPYNEAVATVFAAIAQQHAFVDVIVRKPGEIERRQNDPGYIEWDVAREGVVLFDASSPRTPRQLADDIARNIVRERAEPESVAMWIEHAMFDLRTIDVLLDAEPVLWATACFHAQQAAEKFLKALLVARSIRPPRTHELSGLYDAVCAAGYNLPAVRADCALLEPYVVSSRYPGVTPIPDEAAGRRAVDAVRRIVDAARLVRNAG